METEAKTCQNCKNQFVIEPADFDFYKKMAVPPPTFCFDCRVQRRMAFRNERALYKRKCDFPGHTEEMLSIFAPDSSQKRVYDHAAWWGDGWDPRDYGREIDWTRPFLTQVKELWQEVPDVALMNINPTNSEYCNITEGNKNCYLVFGGDFNEDTVYSTYIFRSNLCSDTYWVQNSELCYELVDCSACNRLSYSRYCDGCYDGAFLFNCRNSHHCVASANLSNASYCIFNVQYSKEEYFERLKDLKLDTTEGVAKMKKEFAAHILKFPRRFAKITHSTGSTGDNLENCKNCVHCFDVFEGAEDCRNIFLNYSKVKDSADTDRTGLGAELCYDCSTVYPGSKVMFSRFTFASHDIQYSYNSHNSAYLFGCVGLRDKQYCILNKQYAKEEYEELVPKIIEHMNSMPYKDRSRQTYAYGEFFPIELSPFAYNETLAMEMFPLTEEKAIAKGFYWREMKDKGNKATLVSDRAPASSQDISEDLAGEILECAHEKTGGGQCNERCTKVFKLIPAELQLYKRIGVPLPTLCPSCRHFSRIKQRNPMVLYQRTCDCAGVASENKLYSNLALHGHGDSVCTVKFDTTYAPERAEIVYCEECYQAETA